jgi:hypothetical protein
VDRPFRTPAAPPAREEENDEELKDETEEEQHALVAKPRAPWRAAH